jgi:sodium-dependent dicarboxylate transporter 2/3/5
MSNAATAALLIPIAVPLAERVGVSPAQLTAAMTLATSFGFTMPSGTANAVALASGAITTRELARAGVPMNLLGIILVTAATFMLVPLVFGPPRLAGHRMRTACWACGGKWRSSTVPAFANGAHHRR